MLKKEYKPIIGYEDYYIYNDGRVWSTKRNIFLSPKISADGYASVGLSSQGKIKWFRINRLVAIHFIPNEDSTKTIVNHKDENKLNNNVDNLEWVDYYYNNNYGTKKERIAQTLSKSVIMCDKDTHEEIQEFNSMKEAAQFLGMSSGTHIGQVLKGERNSAGGYFWKNK